MRLKISHMTEYHYDEPVQFSLQRLRLTPLDPARPDRDQLGDCVSKAPRWRSATTIISATASISSAWTATRQVIAHRRRAARSKPRTAPASTASAYQAYCPLWLYLRETPLTKMAKPIRNLAKTMSGDSDLARMHALMAAIHEIVEYRPGETARKRRPNRRWKGRAASARTMPIS